MGQYMPGNSFLHRLDPRTKFIGSALLIVTVFLLKGPVQYAVFGAAVLGLYVLGGVSGSLLRSLRPGIYLVFFTLFLNMIFTPGEITIIRVGVIRITREGVLFGFSMGFRLIFLISVSSLVSLTTSPVRMTDGLELLFKPLKKIGFPSGELAMMMNIALRFIPTFWEETDKIIKAQISRGADFNSWNPLSRIKYMTALLVPLFLNVFRKSDELALAMEARGYEVGMDRSSLHKLQFNLRDYLILVLAPVLLAVFILYRSGLN